MGTPWEPGAVSWMSSEKLSHLACLPCLLHPKRCAAADRLVSSIFTEQYFHNPKPDVNHVTLEKHPVFPHNHKCLYGCPGTLWLYSSKFPKTPASQRSSQSQDLLVVTVVLSEKGSVKPQLCHNINGATQTQANVMGHCKIWGVGWR